MTFLGQLQKHKVDVTLTLYVQSEKMEKIKVGNGQWDMRAIKLALKKTCCQRKFECSNLKEHKWETTQLIN